MRTLILDTSGHYSTAAVVAGGEAVACTSVKIQPLSHLHAVVRELLARARLDLAAIDRLAVVSGPGSWTGLNIGVTAAKTLAQVLSRPLVELASLDALVATERWLDGPVYGVLDAKRSRVYASVYDTDPCGEVRLGDTRLELMSFDDFKSRLEAAEGRPLVVEYGAFYRPKLERESGDRICVSSYERLSVSGLVAAYSAGHGTMLEGEAAFGLSPRYLQKALGG